MNRGLAAAGAGIVLVASVGLVVFLSGKDEPARPPPPQPSLKPDTPPRMAAKVTPVTAANETAEILLDAPEWTKAGEVGGPAADRLRFVSPRGDDAADGSKETPWKDLQTALCRLEPGDHLVVLRGNYSRPLRVAAGCKDGTAEKPIQVSATKDAVVSGERGDEPVLRIGRAHWRLTGFELNVDWTTGVAVLIEAPAKDITVASFHIRNGVGGGIEVGPGVRNVTLVQNHIHHLGVRKGGPTTRLKAPAAGIRVAPGARDVRLVRNNVHSIFGPSLEITGAEGQVTLEGNAVQQNPPDD